MPKQSKQQYQFTVTVIYTGVKATQYFSKHSRVAVNQLKEDLSLLKFPMPKSDHVSFVSHGCMGAFWIGSLDSQMYQCISMALGQDPYFSHGYGPSDLERLAIKEILFDKQCGYVHPVILFTTLTGSHFMFDFNLGNKVASSIRRITDCQAELIFQLEKTKSRNALPPMPLQTQLHASTSKALRLQSLSQSQNHQEATSTQLLSAGPSTTVKRPAPQENRRFGARDPDSGPKKRVRTKRTRFEPAEPDLAPTRGTPDGVSWTGTANDANVISPWMRRANDGVAVASSWTGSDDRVTVKPRSGSTVINNSSATSSPTVAMARVEPQSQTHSSPQQAMSVNNSILRTPPLAPMALRTRTPSQTRPPLPSQQTQFLNQLQVQPNQPQPPPQPPQRSHVTNVPRGTTMVTPQLQMQASATVSTQQFQPPFTSQTPGLSATAKAHVAPHVQAQQPWDMLAIRTRQPQVQTQNLAVSTAAKRSYPFDSETGMHSSPGVSAPPTSAAEAKRVKTSSEWGSLVQTSVSSSTVPGSDKPTSSDTNVPAVSVAPSSAGLGPLPRPLSHQSDPSRDQFSSIQQPADSQTSVTSDRPLGHDISEKLKEAKELEEQLVTIRKLLNEHLKREQKLCQQLQQTDPECHMTQIRRKGYLTSVNELRTKAGEAEAELKKVLAEKEAELQNERKGRVEVEEALRRERTGRAKVEEELQNEQKSRVEIEERLRKSCADAEKELENERKNRTVLEAELQNERRDRIIIEAELQCEQKFRTEQASRIEATKAAQQEASRMTHAGLIEAELRSEVERGKSKCEELERQLEVERKRRGQLEEMLSVESRQRVEAEELLKDVERECRSPFVVPALLEAFATISSVTSRALAVKP